jgi:hypothetical protein
MSNVWTQFENLLEKDTTQIATIISSNGTTTTVELLSGDRLKVIGTGAEGTVIYIKGGEIKQQAPSLARHNMVLY